MGRAWFAWGACGGHSGACRPCGVHACCPAYTSYAEHTQLLCHPQTGLSIGAAIYLWRQPVAQIPSGVAWPMGSMLASPHGKDFSAFGYVAAAPWLFVCGKAGNVLARAVFSVRQPSATHRGSPTLQTPTGSTPAISRVASGTAALAGEEAGANKKDS